VYLQGLPTNWLNALTWAVQVIGSKGHAFPCARCSVLCSSHLLCSRCPLACCPSCLHFDRDAEWHLGWECPACAIEALVRLSTPSEGEAKLAALIDTVFEAQGSRLRPSTWRLYHRCVDHVISLSQSHGIPVIPVLSQACAWGLASFLAHLRHLGFSWGQILHYSSAIRSLHLAWNFPDPFSTYPLLTSTMEGLKRMVGTRVNRKQGITLDMLLDILAYLRCSEIAYRAAGQHSNADIALTKQVIFIIAWAGMRRGAEMWLLKSGQMGLRRRHISFLRGSYVRLFIQSMKNDVYSEVYTVDLSWVTGSGIEIGATIVRYLGRYDASNLSPECPLFLQSHHKGGFYHTPGSVSSFASVVKDTLPLVFVEMRTFPQLLAKFSFHSLRRGGDSWAYRQGVPLKSIMSHGIWKSKQGITPYLISDLTQRLDVTRAM